MRGVGIRKIKSGTYSLATVLLLIGIIALINYLSNFIFFRIDLSEGNVYSLSKASKRMVAALDDPVVIRAYFTKRLPPPYNANRKYVEDLLGEYRAYSRGKISYEVRDPSESEKIRIETRNAGIAPLRFQQIEKDKFEIKEGYMGLLFLYGDKKEIIPVVRNTEGLEYDITGKIKMLMQKEKRTIGYLTGHGEPDLNSDLGDLKDRLSEQYVVKTTNLKDGEAVPDDIEALLVLEPKEKISEREKYSIDQCLMRGRPCAFMLSHKDVDMKMFSTSSVDSNIFDLIQHYGIDIRKGFVLDLQNLMIGITERRGFVTITNRINYPLIPIATNFGRGNPIVKGLEAVTMPFVHPLVSTLEEEDSVEEKDRPRAEVLVMSTEKSWYREDVSYLNPFQKYAPFPTDERGPFNLVMTLEGKFDSFYAGKDIPSVEIEKGEEEKKAESQTEQERIDRSPNTRILVSGTGKFIVGEFSGDNFNRAFFLNIVDWLMQDEDLIAIRSKGATYRPLRDISNELKSLIKYINMFLMPLLLVIFGLFRWKLRKIQKSQLLNIS